METNKKELMDKLGEIDLLSQKIEAHGKLQQDVLKKVKYRFRLDWNYYSNRMEGGTLTREETRNVMIGNIDIQGKPLKDVLEMNGHDKIVIEILKIGKGELRISEKRIKEIHKAIMHEENDEKLIEIGTWKTNPNEIINYKNEKIAFAPPSEVPERMHKLLDETNAGLDAFFSKKKSRHPVEMASRFHLEYVTIHPFYDGNGRTARILSNLILISCGLPPIILKDNHKKLYYQLLADIQAYGGNPDLFLAFIADRVIDSQRLVLDTIEGKDIDEPDDIDKKLALLDSELATIDPDMEIRVQFGKEVLLNIYDTWFTQLVTNLIPAIQKFNKYFEGNRHWISIQNGAGSVQFTEEPPATVLQELRKQLIAYQDRISTNDTKIIVQSGYGPFKKGGLDSFGCNYFIEIWFNQIKYEIYVDEFTGTSQRKQRLLCINLLHTPLSESTIEKIVKHVQETIYSHIDFHTKQRGLR